MALPTAGLRGLGAALGLFAVVFGACLLMGGMTAAVVGLLAAVLGGR